MLKLYIANKNYSSWSLRPWLLMRELGIPFVEQLVNYAPPGEPSAFLAFSPSGRVPCLIDEQLVVWDSLAITEYLFEHYPAVWPTDRVARAWARCAAAEMHSGFFALRNACSMNCGVRVRMNDFSAELHRDLLRLDHLWRDGLARFGGPFLAGSTFTAVDAFFAPVAFRVQTYGLPVAALAAAYVERLLSQPAMQEWYLAALAEPWRDPEHELETISSGLIEQDLRRPVASGP